MNHRDNAQQDTYFTKPHSHAAATLISGHTLSRLIPWLALILLAGGLAGATGKSLPLDRLKTWTIVVAPEASPSEQYAAEEFRALFRQALGTELAISRDQSLKTRVVRIGPGPTGRSPEKFGDEEFLIQIHPEDISIAGGRPRGTLYGVYEFFERYFQCEFLTYDHTWFPRPADLSALPVEDYRYRNPFTFRWSYYQENGLHPEFAVRQRINTITADEKLGGKTPQNLINHSYYKWVDPSKYPDHPEYFSLVNGVRLSKLEVGETQPCPTDPTVMDIVTQGVLAELAANPKIRNISVSQNDNANYCRCPRCEAINQREGTPAAANLMLVNAVAERVEKMHPDVMIGTLTYWYTRKPPKTMAPRHNVQIQLCSIECCTLHAINDPHCPKNRAFCEDLKGWKRLSKQIWIWNYDTNFSCYDLPFPNLLSIGSNVKFFVENNARGVFMQANGNGRSGEFCDLRNYVISKCLWKPGLNSWTLVGKFCRLHYGKAADDILTWLQREHTLAEQMGTHPDCGPTPERLGLTPAVVREALATFARAREKADNDEIRQRVDKASICIYKAALLIAPVAWQYTDGVVRRGRTSEGASLLDRYAALCETYHMTMHSESKPLERFLKEYREPADVPAAQIENAVWRATVVPGYNGSVVDLIHKPTGRQMLRAMNTADLEKGRLETYVVAGTYAREQNMKCDLVQTKDAITLNKRLSDGTIEERVIRLSEDSPEQLQISFRLVQGNAGSQLWRFTSQTGFDPGTSTPDADKLTVYAKAPEWKVVNRGWKVDDGPEAKTLLNAKGGGLAFYNHEAKFGALISYVTQETGQIYFFWHPERPQLNLDVRTPTVTLAPGQVLQLHYTLEHITEPPR